MRNLLLGVLILEGLVLSLRMESGPPRAMPLFVGLAVSREMAPREEDGECRAGEIVAGVGMKGGV